MKMLGKMAPEERKARGAVINAAKSKIEAALNERRQELANEKLQAKLNAEAIDVTDLPWDALYRFTAGRLG